MIKKAISILLLLVLMGVSFLQAQQSSPDHMKKVLLIIDIQNDYFKDGKMALVNAEGAAMNAKLIVDDFRANNWPVVIIQHQSSSPNASFFAPNTEGVEIHELLKPLAGEKHIVKHYPNAFRETDLLEHMKQLGYSDLVICGMMTHMCVDATVRAAKDYGYNIELIGDACATRNLELDTQEVSAEEVHISFLSALNGYYAKVMTTKDYLQK